MATVSDFVTRRLAMTGDPKCNASQQLPDFPSAGYAESIGHEGLRIDRPEAIGAAWDTALTADRPCIIEAIADPEVPPLPPHITVAQSRTFASAVAKGDPAWRQRIKLSFQDWVESKFPGEPPQPP